VFGRWKDFSDTDIASTLEHVLDLTFIQGNAHVFNKIISAGKRSVCNGMVIIKSFWQIEKIASLSLMTSNGAGLIF